MRFFHVSNLVGGGTFASAAGVFWPPGFGFALRRQNCEQINLQTNQSSGKKAGSEYTGQNQHQSHET